jgi:hypothetical protein
VAGRRQSVIISGETYKMGEFIVIRGQPYHQPIIINTDAIAVVRPKTEGNGAKRLEIVMTSGVAVATDMTFEDLVTRLRASPT